METGDQQQRVTSHPACGSHWRAPSDDKADGARVKAGRKRILSCLSTAIKHYDYAGRLAIGAGACPRNVLTVPCSTAPKGSFLAMQAVRAQGRHCHTPQMPPAQQVLTRFAYWARVERQSHGCWFGQGCVWTHRRATDSQPRVPIECCNLAVQTAGPHVQHVWAG